MVLRFINMWTPGLILLSCVSISYCWSPLNLSPYPSNLQPVFPQCVSGSVRVEGGACSPYFQRCDDGAWTQAKCVAGVFNLQRKACVPWGGICPVVQESGTRMQMTTRRFGNTLLPAKESGVHMQITTRQLGNTGLPDCSLGYLCPANLLNSFVYPYWPSCDSYVLCEQGRLSVVSCTSSGLPFYNPRAQTCENAAAASNTCLFRENTDLSPVFK